MRPLTALLLLASAAPPCLSIPHMEAQGTEAQTPSRTSSQSPSQTASQTANQTASTQSPQAQSQAQSQPQPAPVAPSAAADPFGALGLGLASISAINPLTQPTLTP